MKREIQSDDHIPAGSRRRIVHLASRGVGWFGQLFLAIFLLVWALLLLHPVVYGGTSVFALESMIRLGGVLLLLVAMTFAVVPDLLSGVVRWRHRRAAQGSTWRDDHPWKPGPQLRSPVGRALRPLHQGVGLLPMLFMFRPGANVWVIPYISHAMWLVMAGAVAWGAYRIHGLLWSGTLRVKFDPFPVAPGEQLMVTFGTSRGASPLTHLVLRLRCVTDAKNAVGFGRAETRLQWQETVTIDDPDALPAPGSDIEVPFDLPSDRPPTHLARKYPTCWELSVTGKTGDASYEEVFLVPVYSRDAS